MPKYPQVQVELVGEDGNALAVITRACRAAKLAGLSKEQVDEYRKEAMSGDYYHVLNTTMDYFNCDGLDDDDEDSWTDDDEEEEDSWPEDYDDVA